MTTSSQDELPCHHKSSCVCPFWTHFQCLLDHTFRCDFNSNTYFVQKPVVARHLFDCHYAMMFTLVFILAACTFSCCACFQCHIVRKRKSKTVTRTTDNWTESRQRQKSMVTWLMTEVQMASKQWKFEFHRVFCHIIRPTILSLMRDIHIFCHYCIIWQVWWLAFQVYEI